MSTSSTASPSSPSGCRHPQKLPVDEDLAEWRKTRDCILKEWRTRSKQDASGSDAAFRRQVRNYCKNAIEPRSNLGYAYRHFDHEFPLEEDLLALLDAFASLGKGDIYACAIPDLKLIRRVAFQRYAFGLVRETNRRLLKLGESPLWLLKDFALPRIPLALLIGYGAVLGSISSQLWTLRGSVAAAAGMTILTLSASWFLIYNNVRDRIGGVPAAWGRATLVFTGALAWCGLFALAGRCAHWVEPGLPFDLGNALLVSQSGLLVAIVAQFFFTKSGSIADPL